MIQLPRWQPHCPSALQEKGRRRDSKSVPSWSCVPGLARQENRARAEASRSPAAAEMKAEATGDFRPAFGSPTGAIHSSLGQRSRSRGPSPEPCKGDLAVVRPFRARWGLATSPRALPWAGIERPLGARGTIGTGTLRYVGADKGFGEGAVVGIFKKDDGEWASRQRHTMPLRNPKHLFASLRLPFSCSRPQGTLRTAHA